MRLKIVLCAEYQGADATVRTVTGFQVSVDQLLDEMGHDGSVDVVVFCLGRERSTYLHPKHSTIRYEQFAPCLTPQELAPYVSFDTLPFLIELIPWRPDIVNAIMNERPHVIHTFQTIGATDMAGLRAARRMKRAGQSVVMVSTVMTEIETYVANYFESFINEAIEFSGNVSYLSELKAAWNMKGAFRPPSVAFRLFNVAYHLLNHPICKALSWFAYKRSASRKDSSPAALTKRDSALMSLLRRLIRLQIRTYLREVDAVTTSRPEDGRNYHIAPATSWHMPLSASTDRFRPEEVTCDVVGAALPWPSTATANDAFDRSEMQRFLDWINDEPMGFAIISVGRLSDEKNPWLLSSAFEKLLADNPKRPTVWLACGTGVWKDELRRRFHSNVVLPGLVPNDFLPFIYNLARSHRFVFVSASDTETYGITLAEAQLCGQPIVGMELGTRSHFLMPCDTSVTARADDGDFECEHSDEEWHCGARLALNGICISDYTKGAGLNAIRMNPGDRHLVDAACAALHSAIVRMSQLSPEAWMKMTEESLRFCDAAKMKWSDIWEVLRDCIYANDRESYDALTSKFTESRVRHDRRVAGVHDELKAVLSECDL